ncbi:MAG: type I restriction endonuclease, partial [Gemmataceae bacterium]
MTTSFTESDVEKAALAWLAELGYAIAHGPEIVDSERGGEYGQVVLESRLRQALRRLNPKVPPSAIEEAFRKLTRPDSQ